MIQKLRDILARMQRDEYKWKIYVLLGVVVYFIAINQVIHVRPDHVFVALVLLSFLLGKERARRFLVDWLPFVLFWVAYDMMRGVADSVRGQINIADPYRWEVMLFQPLLHGDIPAFYFQVVRETMPTLKQILNLISANLYTLHFAMPLLLGWIFWHTTDDRPMYYKFVYTLTVLNAMALITFMLYPAAPPWYVYHYGFVQPIPESSYWGTSAGNLIDVDKLFGISFFTTLWDSFNSNHFAAIPSLHGAYPVVVSYFAWLKFRKRPVLLSLYPALTWFAAVYLNQHYVIDLLIGLLYIVFAYAASVHFLYPKVFRRFIEKGEPEGKPVVEKTIVSA